MTLDAPATPPNSYAFRRTITIDHSKVVNATQSNFPVLVSGTYSYLAATANGGNVQNANGYDVIFTSDTGCTAKLNHEVETYTATTGAVNYWVKVPSLSHTTGTTIYLCYGNPSVTTDQSNKTAVWDANYKGVWHLPNGTTLNPSDSTTNANNGTITGALAAAGKLDGGASLNGTSDHVQVKAGKVDTSATTGTVSAWVKVSALDKNGVVLGYGGAAATDAALWGVYIREVGGSYYFAMSARKTNGGAYSTVRGNTALTAGTWYYVTYSTNGSAWKIRVNGATAQTLTAVLGTNTGDWIGDITASTPDKSDIGGIYVGGAYSGVNFWHGTLDEVRLSNVERSDNWVATEYNNQSSPSTFYTISSPTSLVAPSQVQWLVADHLGTPRMILDQTGALANMKRHDYLPFGEELFAPAGGRTTAMGYTSGDGIRQQFTQYERDIETGLDYAQARYYSNAQGRFTGVDPLFESAELIRPQSWNRYSYALNDPLQYLDPTGTVWVKDSSNNRIWIPHDKWDAVSQATDKNGNRLYTILTADEMEYDSVTGQRVKLDPMGPNANNPRGWSFIGPNQGSGAGAMLGTALIASQLDSPAPGPGDVAMVGLGIAALYLYLNDETLLLPLIFNEDNSSNTGPSTPGPSSDAPADGDFADRPAKIASALGLPVGAVKDAIHQAKKHLPKGGPVKNPDVEVDLKTGEIYLKIPGGGRGDSIGNIWDHIKP